MKKIALLNVLMFLFLVPFAHAESFDTNISDIVSVKRANDYLTECKSVFPRHFTPNALHNYCSCSAANIRIFMSDTEFTEIERKRNLVAGDPIFEKYIQKVIIPCMEVAVPDIARVACLEDRGHSPYITNILPYCSCVSDRMTSAVKKQGAATIVVNMTRNPKFYDDPVQTLLESSQYRVSKYNAQRECRPIGMQSRENR
ncbi:MAG: hypothetical protein ACPG05_03090 [Bdellovibrionales bacterium]